MSVGQVLLEVHGHMSTMRNVLSPTIPQHWGGISHLANGLQNGYGMFKVSNMEYRNHKFDIRVMPNAIDGGLSTGFAKCVFLCCALTISQVKIYQ